MVKVGFPDKVAGLWAFDTQMPFQKYQGPPIVVRYKKLLQKPFQRYISKPESILFFSHYQKISTTMYPVEFWLQFRVNKTYNKNKLSHSFDFIQLNQINVVCFNWSFIPYFKNHIKIPPLQFLNPEFHICIYGNEYQSFLLFQIYWGKWSRSVHTKERYKTQWGKMISEGAFVSQDKKTLSNLFALSEKFDFMFSTCHLFP